MSWIEIRAVLPPSQDRSIFIEVFRNFGIENTLEETDQLVGALPCVPASSNRAAEITRALIDSGAISVSTAELPEVDWEEAWKQHFKPRRVGRNFIVRPTWEPGRPADGDIEIVLDPGQAFGTGDHPTTRMCIELLEAANLTGAQVCDVGCGSGILSVAACKLGAKSVLAIDIEPISVEVAIQNALLNHVAFEARIAEGIMDAPGPFDLVVSNIISAILIRLAKDVFSALRPKGVWIVSGIILQNWDDVLASAKRAGFILANRLEEDGWVAATFHKA